MNRQIASFVYRGDGWTAETTVTFENFRELYMQLELDSAQVQRHHPTKITHIEIIFSPMS